MKFCGLVTKGFVGLPGEPFSDGNCMSITSGLTGNWHNNWVEANKNMVIRTTRNANSNWMKFKLLDIH